MAYGAADFAGKFMFGSLVLSVEKAQIFYTLDEANFILGEDCSPLKRSAMEALTTGAMAELRAYGI